MPTHSETRTHPSNPLRQAIQLVASMLAMGLVALIVGCGQSGSSSSGNPTFSKSYGSPGDDLANKAIPTNDGGFLMTGVYGASFQPGLEGSEGSLDGTSGNLWAMKLDAYGDIQWNRTFGSQPPASGSFVEFQLAREAADGSLWIAYRDLNSNP
ncbi:MAG: hypothetical protein P1V35_08035, partial [Planctomycetota bacterium]|nr:hypothetical protein [Planctomycetota bacterium]